jgi:hypothetical protein
MKTTYQLTERDRLALMFMQALFSADSKEFWVGRTVTNAHETEKRHATAQREAILRHAYTWADTFLTGTEER